MSHQDAWIRFREFLLHRLTGSDGSQTLNAPILTSPVSAADNPAAALHHGLLNTLAQHTAPDGRGVDYAALHREPVYQELQHHANRLNHFDPATLTDRNARLEFWINLYNSLIMHAVVALGVKRSVMEHRAGLWFFRQAAYCVGGQRMSCDDIEHGILRLNRGHPFVPGPHYSRSDPRRDWVVEPFEPRVHFALNCASRSCPPIRVYAADGLDAQLELATRGFLASEVSLAQDSATLHVSSIFNWFSGDFGGRQGVIGFVLEKHPDADFRERLSAVRERVALRYTRYDWGINERV